MSREKPKEKLKQPTDAELEILRVLWTLGPSSVREVHTRLSEERRVGYTSVLKFMQIMTEKGLLSRNSGVKPQIFRPTRTKVQTQRQLLRNLADRAFAGSPGNLVLQALSTKRASKEELFRIRELLDRLEQGAEE